MVKGEALRARVQRPPLRSLELRAVFVLYELEDHATLASAAYLASLNAPTEWSRKLMPHHRQMVRCPCHVLDSHGAAVAGHALTRP